MRLAALFLVLATTACVEYSPDLEVEPLDETFVDPRVAPPLLHVPQSPQGLLSTFSGCLTFDDFVASNMGPAWASLSTTSGACVACHGQGEFGFVAASDQELFFQLLTSDAYQMSHYFTVDVAAEQVVVAEQSIQAVAVGTPPNQQHPRFPFDNPGMTALRAWHAMAVARQGAGTCESPRF
jgi:hypothetical protein